MTLAELAGSIGFSVQHLSAVELAQATVSEQFVVACDEALEAGGKLVELLPATVYERAIRRHRKMAGRRWSYDVSSTSEIQPAQTPLWQDPSGTKEAAARRRELMKTIATMVATAGTPGLDAIERVMDTTRRGHIDKQLIASHVEIADVLAGLYRSADPSAVLPMAMVYAHSVRDLLDGSMSERDRDKLAAVVVGVHAQVGLWACHVHRLPLAERYLSAACDVANGTGDGPLRARALGAYSYLFSSAPRGGRGGNPRRTLDLLDEAIELSAHADGFTRGRLAVWRADQYAMLGKLAAARADLETADRALAAGDGGQIAGFFSRRTYGYGVPGLLDSVRAVVLALANKPEESERLFTHVQSSAANQRRRIATYGHAALVRTLAKDPEGACDALSRSIELAAHEHYAMGLRRAIGVRARFDPSWTALPCVRSVDEQLRAQVAR